MLARWTALSAAIITPLLLGSNAASQTGAAPKTVPTETPRATTVAERAPCTARFPERQPLFGDLHVHTSVSMDANARGTLTSPKDAYRYAAGYPVEVYSGDPVRGMRVTQIDRPLDFAAVTDHAEWMAEFSLCTTPESPPYNSPGCRNFRGDTDSWLSRVLGLKDFRSRVEGPEFEAQLGTICSEENGDCRDEVATVWRANQEAAESWYDRSVDCAFTTFHGWEYGHAPNSTREHRNVILRNEIVPEFPISSLETPSAMGLRRQLSKICNDTDSGCEAIAIPHNPNLSSGQMFRVDYSQLPLAAQRREAALRAQLEPIVEMMQIKGESECRNGLPGVVGAPDELCGFEKTRVIGQPGLEDCQKDANGDCISRNDFVRYALLEGLREEARIGVNPYVFGFAGSTDTHMSAPGATSEHDVPYKFGLKPDQLLSVANRKGAPAFWNPGGLTGVWAEENSRDSIFDALKRRETFATSGPRIVPRFFGGWDFVPGLCDQPIFAAVGYDQGVPMGAELPPRPPGRQAPVFAVSALADSGTDNRPGSLLQRLQIIKGWVDDAGQFHQEIHEVAGDPENGAHVDLDTCAPKPRTKGPALCTEWKPSGPDANESAVYSHRLTHAYSDLAPDEFPDHCLPAPPPGDASLCAVWRDPDFNPNQSAVYYARVIENPSCRWSARLCLFLPEDKRPDGCTSDRLPKTIQERAWTSPIWYRAGTGKSTSSDEP